MITQTYLKELFEYKDGFLYWKISKGGRKAGSRAGGNYNQYGYEQIGINKKVYGTHQLVFIYFNGYKPIEIDHIDGNTENNKIENLREANRQGNTQNQKIRSDNKSGVKGVCWYKATNQWKAQIQTNGERKLLGYFDRIEDAEKTIKQYREHQHREFANHG